MTSCKALPSSTRRAGDASVCTHCSSTQRQQLWSACCRNMWRQCLESPATKLLPSAAVPDSPWHWLQRCHACREHSRLAQRAASKDAPTEATCRHPEFGCLGGVMRQPQDSAKCMPPCCGISNQRVVQMQTGISGADGRGGVAGTSEMGPTAAAHSRKFFADHRACTSAGLHGGRRSAAAARSIASSGCDAAAGSGLCAGPSKSVRSTSQEAGAAAGHKCNSGSRVACNANRRHALVTHMHTRRQA